MKLLHNRPLATCCFVFLFVLTLSANTDRHTKRWLGAAAVFFLLLALILFLRRRRVSLLLPFCAMAALFALLYGYMQYDHYFNIAERYCAKEVTICARVDQITYADGQALGALADCETINGEPENVCITIWAYTSLLPEAGDRVTFTTTLTAVTAEDSDSLYLRAQGVAARAEEVFDLAVEKGALRLSDKWNQCFTALRTMLSQRLIDCIPRRGGSLASALLLGEKVMLDNTVVRDFRRTGLSHILALSGLHLSLLVGALATLCRHLRIPHHATRISQIIIVLFYMALTGFSLSITRAGVMTLLVCLSFFAKRQADGITSLAFAATLIIIISPMAIYDCGYWLSLVATLGILIRNEWRKRCQPPPLPRTWFRRFLHGMIDALGITLTANLATLPLLAVYFGEVSLIAPLCNLILVPFFHLYLLLSILILPFGGIEMIGKGVGAFAEILLTFVERFSSLHGILLSIHNTVIQLLLFAAAIIILFCFCASRIGRKKTAFISISCLLVLIFCIGSFQLHHRLTRGITYRYTGSNEILLLQDAGAGLLCDLSSGSYTAQKQALRAIKEAHLTELDGYLITHYHKRHTTSLPRLHGQIMIRTLYLPTPQNETEEILYRELTAFAAAQSITCIRYTPYEHIAFGSLIVQPHKNGARESTHPAIAISLYHQDKMLTYLSAGYHESDQQNSAASAVRTSNALIFGLHGGKENRLPNYSVFSSHLNEVILPYEERIPATLIAFLDNRVHIVQEGESFFLPLK